MRSWPIAALAVATAGGVHARDGGGERALQGLTACRAIAVEARLACFERATAALEAAVRAKEITIADRQELGEARRSLFGFTIPRIPLFGGRDGPEPTDAFTELNTTIVSARPIANGRVQLQLAEGEAVWATTDPVAFPPKSGSRVRIRQGALGNYFIAVDGERSVRGVRVR